MAPALQALHSPVHAHKAACWPEALGTHPLCWGEPGGRGELRLAPEGYTRGGLGRSEKGEMVQGDAGVRLLVWLQHTTERTLAWAGRREPLGFTPRASGNESNILSKGAPESDQHPGQNLR